MRTTERLTELRRGDLVLDVIDDGPLDGTPVVLLHGFPQRATSWNGVTPHLHERGARTYALDQRGYSPRGRATNRFGYRASALVADVHALIEAIGEPVHLVGHDWGAAGAWGVASRHGSSITTLTAVSVPHPGAYVRSYVRSTQALRSYYIALFQLPFLPEWMLSRRGGIGDWLLRRTGMTDEMVETYHREIVDSGSLPGALGYYRSMPLTGLKAFPRKVTMPTTLVWSDGDTTITRKAAELTAPFVTGDYAFEVMEGVSHWILDEQPAELAGIIARRAGLETP